jgi:hypothetical protein
MTDNDHNMTDNKSLKLTRRELFAVAIDVDVALDRFYTLANRAVLTGEYGINFHHPLFAKALFLQDSDGIHDDVKIAYREFANHLERNGFKIQNTRVSGETYLIWISWLQ